ncbi:MAG: hypothetical protein MR922_09510 [Lachnospiraceae bacterium]|nr:hypothetical protein [Lachnospiraceae bacterium]
MTNDKSKKKITLLAKIGISILALIFSPFILLLGWIIGVIWLLFFRKKLSDKPEKMKKWTVCISSASALSFFIFIYIVQSSAPLPTELVLSPAIEVQELEVNTDYAINLSYTPADASLSNISYTVDDASLATIATDSDNPSILTLHTKEEGTITISAKKGSVESNTLTFKIIDSERIKREAAEEQARLEAEQKRIAEEKAAEEAEQKRLLEEQAAKKEAQRLAEEKAAAERMANQQAEAQRIKETEQAAQNATNNNTAPVASSNQNAESTPAPAQSTPTQNNSSTSSMQNGSMVWIDDTAEKYHKSATAHRMDNAYQVTEEEAVAKGKTRCKICWR